MRVLLVLHTKFVAKYGQNLFLAVFPFWSHTAAYWGCQSTPGILEFRKGAKPDFCLSGFSYYIHTASTSGFEKLSTALS